MGTGPISAPGTGDLLGQLNQIKALDSQGGTPGASGTGGPEGSPTEPDPNAPYAAVAGGLSGQLSQSAGHAADGAKTALAGTVQSNLEGAQNSANLHAGVAADIARGPAKKEEAPPTGPAAATGGAIPGSINQ